MFTSLADVRQGKKTPPSFKEYEDRQKKREIVQADREDELEDRYDALTEREDLIFFEKFVESGRSKSGLQLAHQLFLYGLPDGPRRNIPVRNLQRLARLSGTPKEKLEPHSSKWAREAMRLARNASPMYAFACSDAARESHEADLDILRNQIDALQNEIDDCDVGSDDYMKMIKLQSALRKQWQDSSGVTSGVRISEAAAKIEAAAMLASIHEIENNHTKKTSDPHDLREVEGKCFDID